MAVQLTLKVYKGEELIASKDYDRDIIKIGRLSSAHLCLDDEKVSRIHSVIEVAPDGNLSIIDMGSVEGTYVNGKRVNKGALSFGDEIRVGNTMIRVSGAEAAANLAHATAVAAPAEASEDKTQAGRDVATALAQAAQAPEAEPTRITEAPQAPTATSDAIDSSFAATQRNETLAPRAAVTPREPTARVRPSRKKGTGPLGLELRFMWGDSMVGEFFLPPGKARSFSVGSDKGVDFEMGDGKLGTPKFTVVTADDKGFAIRFTGKMNGELTRKGETVQLKAAIESGKAQNDGEAYSISLQDDDFAWVDLGAVSVEVCFQPVPKPVFVPWMETVDFTMLNILLVMFFLGGLFMVASMNAELEGDDFADDLNGNDARIAKLIIKPPDVQKNPLLEKLAEQKEKQSGEMAAKRRDNEGQAGAKDAKKNEKGHMAPKAVDPSSKDQARALTSKIFGGKNGLSTVFGSAGLGGELKSAMGGLFGAAAGNQAGFGGLGLKGSGGGGGGTGDTIGIGAIGTKGRGGGTGSYGNGVGVLGGKQSVDVGITASDPEVMGSLDKELIRQVIHRNRNQIRYCYESQLTRFPKLNGKVAVKFVISGSGSVASSSVALSTVNNAELDQCVAGRVRTWQFPKPKGGGVVVVTYPFIFKQTGD